MPNISGVIAIAITLIVGGGFIYVSLSTMATASQMQSWPSVNGTILSSNVTSQIVYNNNPNTGYSQQTEYSPSVKYSYVVNGQNLTGDSINQFGFSTGFYSVAQQAAAKYRVGNQTPVYYNPSNPSQSFLQRSNGTFSWGLVFLVMGIVILIGGIILSLRMLFG